MTRPATLLTCLVLASCGAAPSQELQKTVVPGTNVTLAPGASVTVKDAVIHVRFIAVTEDSRCPRDVTCVWAGQVKARLEIDDGQAMSKVEILAGADTVAGSYRVTLVQVEPQPVSTAKIAPQDYHATLKIDKIG